MKRDVFAFIVMILAIFGQLPLALPFFAGATFIVFAYSLKMKASQLRSEARATSGLMHMHSAREMRRRWDFAKAEPSKVTETVD
jgi:hypothetical protein